MAQSTDLRLKMRDAGAQFKVAKNRLALIALEGTRYAPISDMLTGPTALATSTDPVAAAKVAVEFAKTNDRLEIVGGAMGDTCSTSTGSRRSPRCRRSTKCARRSIGPHPGARNQDRADRRRAGCPAGPRFRGLRRQGAA